MMKSFYRLMLLVFCLSPLPAFPQCAPPAPNCAGCTPVVSDNQNLFSGTWCITGPFSNIHIFNGAVVCLSGSGALVNSSLNGGTLIYRSGTLSNFNAGAGTIRIFGTLSNPVNTSFNGARIVVESGGILNMNSLDVNWELFVDGGVVNTSSLTRVNGSGSICLSNQGQINTRYFQNDKGNGTTALAGRGCIAIAEPQPSQTFLNQPLTSSPNVSVCVPGSFVPSNLRAATVNTHCTGCAAALPVKLVSFRAVARPQGVQLNWQTVAKENHAGFVIERSRIAIDYAAISDLLLHSFGQEGPYKQYRYEDREALEGTFYYRLRQIDRDGKTTFSRPVSVTMLEKEGRITLSPNPTTRIADLHFESIEEGLIDLTITDVNGKVRWNQSRYKPAGTFDMALNISTLPPGLYFIGVQMGRHLNILKMVKK
ncbi:T9SS type A sorting domain-containing protein [Larkinella soli]|uniref:T9SS type A sorting domain-containing protein n=1 Tax=Larkinella soli TaxID=1770527 RepID=UPI000FFB2804|nr:T9SS type A sorting domain-containing protein [Larkinella soli]